VFEFREPPPGPFELRWRLFGIQFRIFPSFFLIYGLIIGLLAWPRLGANPAALALAVAINLFCIGVAIIFISFVQGLVYRSYGLRSSVIIREFFSGVYPEAAPPTALQRIAVALSYPAACFLLFAVVYYSNQQFKWSETSLVAFIVYLILKLIALFWAIIGLLPIFPYPGGQVMLEVFTLMSPRNGLVWTLVISILVGVAYITYTVLEYLGRMREVVIWPGQTLPASIIVAVFFALSVMQNWQLLQYARAQQRQFSSYDDRDDERAPWER
jgi:hypothetical protein